jgi:predicted nuclease of restriction endonuclease-like (RecB) superfamily
MKKPSASKKSLTTAQSKPDSLKGLLTEVRQLIQSARRGVATVVDTFQVMTNFEIGRRIVEHEQKGAKRAAYGAELLKELSARLTQEFGRGFSEDNLSNMRRFFLTWTDRVAQISETASRKLVPTSIRQTPSGKSPFTLSWSHYVVLMTIKDPDERSFYEIESRQSDWDVRELKRQKASCLYERLALSRDKGGIRKLAKEGQVIVRAEDLLKEPLVLVFLGLEEKSGYSETDLEQAIIDRLEHFLLELGKGFLFEAGQKRFTFDEDRRSPLNHRLLHSQPPTCSSSVRNAEDSGELARPVRDRLHSRVARRWNKGRVRSRGVRRRSTETKNAFDAWVSIDTINHVLSL